MSTCCAVRKVFMVGAGNRRGASRTKLARAVPSVRCYGQSGVVSSNLCARRPALSERKASHAPSLPPDRTTPTPLNWRLSSSSLRLNSLSSSAGGPLLAPREGTPRAAAAAAAAAGGGGDSDARRLLPLRCRVATPVAAAAAASACSGETSRSVS